jgi:hypothetical protein
VSGVIDVLDCAEGTDGAIATFCAGVYGGTGDDPCVEGPLCQVTPTTLDFGTVAVGDFADLSFVLKNIGGGTLEGEVTTGCTQYSIQSGGGAYALAAEESVIVVVRFQPAGAGYDECTILTGTDCADVTCTGTGENPPICEVTPETLDFGTVTIGQFSGQNFTIRNAGGGTLDGDVTEACGDYSITSNGGPFSLGAGEQIVVGVRFTPTTAGLQECTVETGQAICADVTCTGVGEEAASCEVVPLTIDFGTVTVGAFKDSTFTITNTGGGTLTGDVAEVCDDYDITAGGGGFSLGGAESRVVTVRFAPGTGGLKECTVTTGTSCDDVVCTGVGEDLPECLVEPTTLDFGTMDVDSAGLHLVFRITNIGGGLLEGEVTETCDEFSFVGGGGPYSLANGEFVDVNVAFEPATVGVKECTIQTGAECANVLCTATVVDEPPECLVEPTTLDYGTVLVGNAVDQVFRITNIGGSLLEGEVSEVCDDYEIIGGAGAYSLANGEFVDVNVRFQPGSGGLKECTVETGTECADVACAGTGQEPTTCDVAPTVLSFGTVTVGEFADLSFTITNTGGGVLSGEVTEACADFDITAGGGAYDLGAGESVDVTVRFQPGTEGLKQCTVATGTECADVSCSGTGELPPICDVAPSPLEFGTVTVGETADLTFTIFNIGGGTLSGTVSETCSDFEIVSGGGVYSLGGGEFIDVTVRFAPIAPGPSTCNVETGTECDDVTCNGQGQEASACDVAPTTLDFGTVLVGDFTDRTFTITNTGGGVLSGEVTETCADFEIVSGGGAYELAGGEFVDVVVRFAPAAMGPADCIVETGTECSNVSCTGAGDMPPACEVMPPALDFGAVLVGDFSDLSFTITNTGGGTLSGMVSEMCDDFDIVSGGGPYDLAAGEFVDVVVRFAPTVLGPATCNVETGTECADVSCTGTGAEEQPVCAVEPTTLNFGTIPVGDFVDLSFTITNTGGGTLSGMVSEMCDDFDIVAGGGPYDLGAGEFVEVMVRFEPTSPGLKECVIETGAECDNVHCTGTGRGEGVMVYFDIKPGSCPNPLNVRSRGVLPAAILGTENFDVTQIDLMTLQLMRDGVGGVMPLRWSYEDVGTPFMGIPCDCHAMHGDGIMDLTLKFDTPEVVGSLGLQGMPEGEVELAIAGNLVDGEPILGADCVRLIGTDSRPSDDDNGSVGFAVTDGAEDGTESEIEIGFYVEVAGHIYLEIFDVRGRTVNVLINEPLGAGTYTATWDRTGYSGERVQSGVYFARLRRGPDSETKKILLVN